MNGFRFVKGQKFRYKDGVTIEVDSLWWRWGKEKGHRVNRPHYSLKSSAGGFIQRGQARLLKEIEQGKLVLV